MANQIRVWHPVAKILIPVIWARILTDQANGRLQVRSTVPSRARVRFTLMSAIFRLMVLSPA